METYTDAALELIASGLDEEGRHMLEMAAATREQAVAGHRSWIAYQALAWAKRYPWATESDTRRMERYYAIVHSQFRREHGYPNESNIAIAARLGLVESRIRSIIKAGEPHPRVYALVCHECGQNLPGRSASA